MSERRLDATHLLTEFPACCFTATLSKLIRFLSSFPYLPLRLPPPADPILTSPMSCLRTLDDGHFSLFALKGSRRIADEGWRTLVLISIAAGQLGLTQASASEQQLGVASVYSTQSGSRTAFTAAHRTLPLGYKRAVTNKKNGRSVAVTITDLRAFGAGPDYRRDTRRGPRAWFLRAHAGRGQPRLGVTLARPV